ncbi:MAG: phenylalanine--tRNA ligase subunit beta [Nanoarchaeota archaeon]
MASVKFQRKEFEKHIKITKEVEEKISLFGTPLQSLNNEEIEIEIYPNRPDLLSMHGFIRSFKAFLGKDESLKKYSVSKPEKNYLVMIDQSVKEVRPFTSCAIMKNLSLDNEKIKEIINIQEKLHATIGRNRKKVAIGIYPLEKIALPITYKALSPQDIKFIPLESEKEMNALQILQKHPAGRAYSHLLEGYKKFPVFIDSKMNILSMPPIINSNETGKINESTKEVFIECSGFNKEVVNKTLNLIVTTLADIGGKIYSMELVYEKRNREITPNLTSEKIKISLENINKLLGISLKESEVERLLKKMGIDYKNKTAQIPAWRTDILHEVDIIEDIAIAYGYNKFIPEIPNIYTSSEEQHEEKIKEKLSDVLVGLGLIEISSYHLIKEREAQIMRIKEKIEVENSKTEYKILRLNLLIPALRILSENKDHEYPQKIFEIGTTFSLSKNKIRENESLIIALSPSNFTEAKQILDYIAELFYFDYSIKESLHPNLINGRNAKIMIKNNEIGYIGEVAPETLRAWNIKMPISVIEISLEEIFKIASLSG